MKEIWVRRIMSDCCGMKEGEIYLADELSGGAYVNCQLPEGSWTGPHWTGFNTEAPWFEVVEKPNHAGRGCGKD